MASFLVWASFFRWPQQGEQLQSYCIIMALCVTMSFTVTVHVSHKSHNGVMRIKNF